MSLSQLSTAPAPAAWPEVDDADRPHRAPAPGPARPDVDVDLPPVPAAPVSGISVDGRLRAPASVIVADFQPIAELIAADDDAELMTRLGEADLERLEEIARRGYLDGHDEGRRDGYREGRARAERELAARLDPVLHALDAAARRLAATDAATLAGLEDEIISLAVDVSREVVGHELAATADPGAAALARAIGLAPDRGEIVARLHPADVAALGEIGGLAPGRSVSIVTDPSVQPGGCVIDVGACRIDAQVEPALERVRGVLLGRAGAGELR